MYQQGIIGRWESGNRTLWSLAASNVRRLTVKKSAVLRLVIAMMIFALIVTLIGFGASFLVKETLPVNPSSLPCVHLDLAVVLGNRDPEVVDYAKTELTSGLEHSIKETPSCAKLYWSLGDVQLWLGDPAEALASYHRYLQLAGSLADLKVEGLAHQLEEKMNGN